MGVRQGLVFSVELELNRLKIPGDQSEIEGTNTDFQASLIPQVMKKKYSLVLLILQIKNLSPAFRS